jgi:hypothetical protein
MSTTYDKAELEAISTLRLMAKRSQLRSRKAQMKKLGVASVTPELRQEIEYINEQIAQISKHIFARTGERE